MDVPEASKHGKKSTSQKLEDQKKVGKTLLCFFLSASNCSSFISLLCVRAAFSRCFPVVRMWNQGMNVCLLAGLFFFLQKGKYVRPIAAVV